MHWSHVYSMYIYSGSQYENGECLQVWHFLLQWKEEELKLNVYFIGMCISMLAYIVVPVEQLKNSLLFRVVEIHRI